MPRTMDWGRTITVPKKRQIPWDKLPDRVDVIRFRWGIHREEESIRFTFSYLYIDIGGEIWSATFPETTWVGGSTPDFKKWLYRTLKRENRWLLRGFSNLSIGE